MFFTAFAAYWFSSFRLSSVFGPSNDINQENGSPKITLLCTVAILAPVYWRPVHCSVMSFAPMNLCNNLDGNILGGICCGFVILWTATQKGKMRFQLNVVFCLIASLVVLEFWSCNRNPLWPKANEQVKQWLKDFWRSRDYKIGKRLYSGVGLY